MIAGGGGFSPSPPAPSPPPPAPYPPLNISGSNWTPNRDGSGNVLNTDFTQLPVLGGWLEVQDAGAVLLNQIETPYRLGAISGDGYTNVVDTWNTLALDRTNQRGYMWCSGGHGGIYNADNALYKLDFKKLTWARPLNRTSSANQLSWDGSALSNVNIGTYYNVPQNDGFPGATHTYDTLVYLPPGILGAGSTNGGLHLGSWARATLNLDALTVNTLFWNKETTLPFVDFSYACSFYDSGAIWRPRNSAYIAKFTLAGTSATDWNAASSGSLNYSYATSSTFFVYNSRAYCELTERRECVSISGASGAAAVRMRYGQAIDAGVTDWTSYHDTITLTSVNGTDHQDLSTANFQDVLASPLQAAGIDYDHATQTIWMCGNLVGGALYRITGIATNTWTVYKVPGVSATRRSMNGTFGRFRALNQGGTLMAYRVSGTSHPLQAMRLA